MSADLSHCAGCGGQPELVVNWAMSAGPQVGAFCRDCLRIKSGWLEQFGATYSTIEEYRLVQQCGDV